MALINRNIVKPVRQDATANGTANGVIYVTDVSQFPINALIQIADNSTYVEAKVVDYVAPNGLLVNVITDGASDNLSGFTTATSSFVAMAPQMVLSNTDPVGLMPGKAVVVTLLAGNATQNVVGGVQYRVVADLACNINVGAAATANDTPIIANAPEIFVFGPIGAVVQLNAFAAGAGKLYLTPMALV